METLAERIAYLIKNKRIKPADVARGADVNLSSLSNLLTGKTSSMFQSNIIKLASYFKVSFDWLYTGLGEMRPETPETSNSHHPDILCNDPEHQKMKDIIIELRARLSQAEKMYAEAMRSRKDDPPEKHAQGGVEKGTGRAV
jgi:transcriptional regulator with XRE-family HTH domain